jgi:hypothetical protein
MGIFRSNKSNPSFNRSAMQVRESIQPIINELERLQESVQLILENIDLLRGFTTKSVNLSNKALINELVVLCTGSLTKAFEIESVMTEMADDLMIEMSTKQISPHALKASMQSFSAFGDHVDESKAHLKLALIDLGVNTTQAREIIKKAWGDAKKSKPIGILKLEKLRGGKEEWDWITEETWKDTRTE